MKHHYPTAVGASLTVIILLGCTLDAEEGTPTQRDLPVDNLRLDVSTLERASGTYESGGSGILFDLSIAQGEHRAVLQTRDGAPLLDSSLRGWEDRAHIFGDLLVVEGRVDDPEPRVSGDPDLLSVLRETPEYQLIAPLKAALRERHVNRALFVMPPQLDGAATQHRVPPGESVDIATWSFWGVANVIIAAERTRSEVRVDYELRSGSLQEAGSLAAGEREGFARSWPGFRVHVANGARPGNGELTLRSY